jgi:hypothetical protein
VGTLLDSVRSDGGHGMMSDRKRYDIDWSSPTPAEAALVDEFAAALRQVREEETEKLWLALYKLELFHDGMIALNADMRDGP